MSNLFNRDFQDFITSLNKNHVKYILVGGYAVILHGYIRSTADMDIWVRKSKENFQKLSRALFEFGAPSIPENEFFGTGLDVWSFGREPNMIEIMNQIKGLDFDLAYENSLILNQDKLQIRYLHLNDLLEAKKAVGRFKDLNDLEQLKKISKK